MKEKVLYIYGYGSNPTDSSTMKVCKEVMDELGYELISYEYDQENPSIGISDIEEFINDNNIKYVIGHSLGGFITLCLVCDIKKIVINPCLKPHIELPKLGNISKETISDYNYFENWLKSGDDTPWVNNIEPVMGLFGDKDELFSYFYDFRKRWPMAYRINSTHRPSNESFTEEIKTKIKEFFVRTP